MYDSLLNFLELAKAHMGAVDARAEIGGKDPTDPRLVHWMLQDGMRLVVVLSEAPENAEAARAKLGELAGSLLHQTDAPRVRESAQALQAQLDEALAALVERAEARLAVVIDRTSPLVWGTSVTDGEGSNVAQLFDDGAAPADAAPSTRDTPAITLGRVLQAVGADTDNRSSATLSLGKLGVVWHRFAGSYRLVVAYDDRTSELSVQGVLRKVLPQIEHLVLAMPPVDPDSGGAKRAHLKLV